MSTVVYYLSHTFTTTRCDDCGLTFTKAIMDGLDCELDPSVGGAGA